jgi:hypothetical protein
MMKIGIRRVVPISEAELEAIPRLLRVAPDEVAIVPPKPPREVLVIPETEVGI